MTVLRGGAFTAGQSSGPETSGTSIRLWHNLFALGRFSGLTQWRRGQSEAPDMPTEPLNTSGLNRWVRHPLYTGAFLYLWGNAGSPFGLATAFLASAYIVIGVCFEERHLVSIYGDAYRRYQARMKVAKR